MAPAKAAVLVRVSEHNELECVFEGLCLEAALGLYSQCRGSQRAKEGLLNTLWQALPTATKDAELATVQGKNRRKDKAGLKVSQGTTGEKVF